MIEQLIKIDADKVY